MATNTPSLEQLSGSIDALPHSLDNLDGLPWCNPTLDQLDAWGTLEQLDAFGYTLDELGTGDRLCVLIADAPSASIAVTTTAEIQFAIEMPAAVSISASATSGVNRVRPMAGSVTGAANFAAVITPIRTMDASVSVAVTDTADIKRIRPFTSSVSSSVNVSSIARVVYSVDSAPNVVVTTTSASNGIFVMAGTSDASVSVVCDAKRIGEDWGNVAIGSEVWGDVAVGSEIWGTVTVGSEVWATQ